MPPSDDGGSPITNYRIEMRTVGSYRWDIVNIEKVTTTSYTVNHLMEETDYEFRVSAENKAGVSQPSDASRSAKYGKCNSKCSFEWDRSLYFLRI